MLPMEVEVDEMANPVLPSVPIRMSMGSFGQFYLNGGLANVPRPDENMGFVHLGKRKERDFNEGGEIIIYEGKRKFFSLQNKQLPFLQPDFLI